MSAKVLKNTVKDMEVKASKNPSDTIRIWESYKEQALLWRALSLIQIPSTLAAIILAIMLWQGRSITLNVPAKPLPGMYEVQELPDVEFLEVGVNFINLIGSYQNAIARRQFLEARKYLVEPMLQKFDKEMLGIELQAIESTKRTQLYFIDPTKTKVSRHDNEIEVSFTGDRLKIVAGRELPPMVTKYIITMTTIPRNELNPYGIVIKNVSYENVKRIES